MHQTKQSKQTNDHFSAKNKLSISEPNFTKSERKVRFGQIFFENDPLDEPKTMLLSKKFYLIKMVIEFEFTLSHSPDCKIVHFKKGFKKRVLS